MRKTELFFVSTIHKSKGREFDDVYMMLDNVCADNDEERRKIYVGLTRAKNRLHIHCSNNIFDDLDTQGAERITDDRQYPMPDEMILQLSHSLPISQGGDMFRTRVKYVSSQHGRTRMITSNVLLCCLIFISEGE